MAGELTDKEFEALLGKESTARALSELPSLPRDPLPVPLGNLPSPISEVIPPELLEATPRLTGGLTGGAVGFATGGPVGAVLGAGIGGGLGQLFRQTQQEIAGEEPLTLKEAGVDVGMAIGEQAIGEAAGMGIAAVLGKMVAPFSRTVETRIFPAIQELARRGGIIEPAKITDSALLDLFHGIAEGSVTGGRGRLLRVAKTNEEVLDIWAKELAEKYITVATPREVGEGLLKGIGLADEAFFAAASREFKSLDVLLENPAVGTGRLKKAARKLLAEQGPISQRALKSETLDNILQAIEDLPDTITFREAQFDRSRLLKASTPLVEGQRDLVEGAAAQIVKAIDKEMELASRRLGGDASSQWRRANALWKEGQKTFRTNFFRTLLRKDPEKVIASLAPRKGQSGILAFKQAIKSSPKEAELLSAFEGGFIQFLLRESEDATTGIVGGKKLLGLFKSFSPETMQAALRPEQIKALKTFATAAEVQQRTVPTPGRFAIMLAQFGALMLRGGTGEAAAVILGPNILAQLLTRKPTAKLLTVGLRVAPESAAGISAMTKLTAAIARIRASGEPDGKAPKKRPTKSVVPLQGPLATPLPSLPPPPPLR